MRRVYYLPESHPSFPSKVTNTEITFMITMGAPIRAPDPEKVDIKMKSLLLSVVAEKSKQLDLLNFSLKILRDGLKIKVIRPFVFELQTYVDSLKELVPSSFAFVENYDDSQCEIAVTSTVFSDQRRLLYLPDSIALYTTSWSRQLKAKGYEVMQSFIDCYLKFDQGLALLRMRKVASEIFEVQRIMNMLYIMSMNAKKDGMFKQLYAKYEQRIDEILGDLKAETMPLADQLPSLKLDKSKMPTSIDELRKYFEV